MKTSRAALLFKAREENLSLSSHVNTSQYNGFFLKFDQVISCWVHRCSAQSCQLSNHWIVICTGYHLEWGAGFSPQALFPRACTFPATVWVICYSTSWNPLYCSQLGQSQQLRFPYGTTVSWLQNQQFTVTCVGFFLLGKETCQAQILNSADVEESNSFQTGKCKGGWNNNQSCRSVCLTIWLRVVFLAMRRWTIKVEIKSAWCSYLFVLVPWTCQNFNNHLVNNPLFFRGIFGGASPLHNQKC